MLAAGLLGLQLVAGGCSTTGTAASQHPREAGPSAPDPAPTGPPPDGRISTEALPPADQPLADAARPAADMPAPHREGRFVLDRRGRMLPIGQKGPPWMFVFDSDGPGMKEPPLVLLPCTTLEEMEQLERRDDGPVLLVSGQIFRYRGQGYLLPTLFRRAEERRNLQP